MNWLGSGWSALRERAHSALTYFKHDEEADVEKVDREASAKPPVAEVPAQRWGLVATDIVDHKDRLELRMEIPGMEKSDLKVEVSGSQIIVSGEKRFESTRKTGSVMVMERAFGHFSRSLPLPEEVDSDKASASYIDGVLAIDLPKLVESKKQRVDVS